MGNLLTVSKSNSATTHGISNINGNAYDIGYNGVMCATILFWIFQNYCNFENEYSKDKLKFNHILGIVGVVTCYIAIITFCIWHIISLTVVLLVLMVIISVAIEYTNYGWNRLKVSA